MHYVKYGVLGGGALNFLSAMVNQILKLSGVRMNYLFLLLICVLVSVQLLACEDTKDTESTPTSTEAGAETPPSNLCQLPAEPGSCEADMPRWFHNSQTDACEMFSYGGCDGNDNNFESQEACNATCADYAAPPSNICELPAESGTCEADITRWFHNPQTAACEIFSYGGCDGNDNNFESQETCDAACGSDN